MSVCNDFSEISVLIPGYSIEDLPTDLPEEGASSLLNAVACAWHPRLIQRSTSIPLFRQAESLTGYPGRRIVLVPAPSESWMPHEWRSVLRDQGHVVIAGCTSREDWLTAIDAALDDDDSQADSNATMNNESLADGAASVTCDGRAAADSRPIDPETRDHFLSLGTVLLQTQLLSRRRHHFVDADNILLGREVRLAADACLSGECSTAKLHLAKCFEHLRETRERFYPMNCYLIDICIPGEDEDGKKIQQLLKSPTPLNLFATGRDISRWSAEHPAFSEELRQAISSNRLVLMTGHDTETRTSVGSMAATVGDIERCCSLIKKLTGMPPRHWARRRFGLTASLPAILHHFGFESAFHVALDDGLYPDRERSQFDWQGTDGTILPAASRIPLAIDSAAGFLRFADRYNESMQDDTAAAIFLARLPSLKSPWLRDLQVAASYAPVLGEFATMDQLLHAAGGSRLAERHEHSEYLSPFLIQSSVLKTEPPISGPATIRQFVQRLESLRTTLGIAGLMRTGLSSVEVSAKLLVIEAAVAQLELEHVDAGSTSTQSPDSLKIAANEITLQIAECESVLVSAICSRVPSKVSGTRGLFLVNSLPFGRYSEVIWPAGWRRPGRSPVIELTQRSATDERMLVKLPPGGFVWLSECESSQTAHPLMEPVKGEAALAEPLILRNRHFEVSLSDRTGGISAVTWHHQRGNRLSQQVGFRYERDQTLPDDGSGEVRKSSYASSRLMSHRVIEAGQVFAAIETVAELISPVDGSVLATIRQITRVDRVQPRLYLTISIENITSPVKGNPWLSYFGCRFAWDNESAAISRAVMGQISGFRAERFESPDYVEISDADHRVVIATHGRPYHRRSGPRMLDSLLIVEGESSREFLFTLDFDQPFPLRTATDALTPILMQVTSGMTPISASGSWILGVSAKNVELVRTEHCAATLEQSEELTLLLSETDGVESLCLVKTARPPTAAYAINADRTEKVSLEITDQGVTVNLTAFQIRLIVLVL